MRRADPIGGRANAAARGGDTAATPLAPGPLTLSLPEQIAAQLAARISSGVYTPGQRVMEQSVAAEFAVSRGPVREALRLLEKDGLVTILARRGAQVTNLSGAEVKEIFDIRAVLNGLRDRGIAEDPDRRRLLPLLEAEVAALARLARDPKRGGDYVETVFRLNRLLTTASRNARLRTILGALAQQTLRYSRLGLSTQQRRRRRTRAARGRASRARFTRRGDPKTAGTGGSRSGLDLLPTPGVTKVLAPFNRR